jgi:uncharacterized lipoprotein YajG
MRSVTILMVLLLFAGCSKQPEKKSAVPVETSTDKEIAKEAKSIEQAADEAAKLIEDDTRQDAPPPKQ